VTWETGASLVEYGLRRANELGVSVTGEGDFEKDYRDYINLAYWDIVGEFPWQWAQKYPPWTFTTFGAHRTTGTLISRNVIRVDSTPVTHDLWGCKLVFESDGIVVRAGQGSIGNQVNIASDYPHATAAGNIVIYRDDHWPTYPRWLSDIAMPLHLQNMRTGRQLELLPYDLFLAKFGANTMFGEPRCYSFITGAIVLGPSPGEPEMFELWHTYFPPALDFSNSSATDTPIVPMHIRWCIADRALFYLLTDMDDGKATLAVANSSERLKEEKNRESVKMAPQWWIPRQYRLARGRF
jgi:hypothetical protein